VNEAQILYLAGGPQEIKRLYVAGVGDANPILLSEETQNVVEYAISPDAAEAVYVTQTDGRGYEFWLVNLRDRSRRQALDCEQAICARPAWSPDGNSIVYEYAQFSGKNAAQVISLWWMDLGTGEAKPVFQEPNLPGTAPRWSPDGEWLSYASPETMRLYNLQTGESLSIESMLAAGVDWSPDGKRVLYRDVVLRDGQFITQLFTYDLSSGTSTNVGFDPGYESLFATWSPDGRWIAAIRRDLTVPLGDQIWLMRVDGDEARPLTDQTNQLHSSLSWSPDGRYLLYDVQFLDIPSSEPNMQMIEVGTGEITDLGFKGYDATWLMP
jgi:TolB protein